MLNVDYLNKGLINGSLTQSREQSKQSMYKNYPRAKKGFRFDDEASSRMVSPSPSHSPCSE